MEYYISAVIDSHSYFIAITIWLLIFVIFVFPKLRYNINGKLSSAEIEFELRNPIPKDN